MHILLSDKRYTYKPTFRFITPKDQQKVKVKFSNDLVLSLGYRFTEQMNYFAMAAEAAFMSLNPIDRQNKQFFVELNLVSHDSELINLQPESTSVGLGYALGAALAYRQQLNKKAPVLEHIFSTGEVSPSGNVHSIGHINTKIEGALHAMASHPDMPFAIFYPKANLHDITPTLIDEVQHLGGALHPVEHINQALEILLGPDFDGSQVGGTLTFKGLCSFDPYDEYYFFGREQQTSELLALFQEDTPLIKVHGVSGSGKSSLVKAGLLPAIAKQYDSVKWHIALPKQFEDSTALLTDFITSAEVGFDIILKMLDVSVESFIEGLLEQKTQYLDELSAHLTAHKTKYIWFIDQFEELYDAQPNSQLLQSLVLIGEITPISIIVSIRSEYLHYTGMQGHDFYVPHSLSAENWIDIIENQAIALGISLETGLAQTIQTEALKLSHALPAVEYLLAQMHTLANKSEHPKVLTYTQYKQLNKLTGVIYRQAEKIFGQFEPLTEQFFELFVGVNINGNCYAKHVDFLALGQQYPQLSNLVDELIEKQLIIRHQVYKSPPYVKLTHDCLITVVEDLSLDQQIWPRFYIWLNDRKEYLQWFHGVETKYTQWIRHHDNIEEQKHYALSKHELNEGSRFLSQPNTICLQEVRNYIMQSQHDYQSSLELQNKQQKRRLLTTGMLFLCTLIAGSFAYVQKQQIIAEQIKTTEVLTHLKDNVLVNIDSLEPILADYLPTFQRKQLNKHLSNLIDSVDGIPLADIDKLRLLLIQVKILRQDDSTHRSEIKQVLEQIQRKVSTFPKIQSPELAHKKVVAQFNYELGILLLKQGFSSDAKVYFEEAISLLTDIPESHHELALLNAQLTTRVATISLESGNTDLATSQLEKVLLTLNSHKQPTHLTQSFNNLRVDIYRNLAKAAPSNTIAKEMLVQAETLLNQLLDKDPNHLISQYNLLKTYINLAEKSASKSIASRYYKKADELARIYAIKDPDNVHVQVAQLLLATRLGKEYLANKQMPESQKYFLSGVEIANKLQRLDISNIDWQGHTIELYAAFANYYSATNLDTQSKKYHQLALTSAQRLAATDENNLNFAYLLQSVHAQVANNFYDLGEKLQALAHFEKAKETLLTLIEKNTTSFKYKNSYRRTLFNLGYIATELGDNTQACQYFLAGKHFVEKYSNEQTHLAFNKSAKKFDHYIELLSCKRVAIQP
ncbi:AAA family ATPase [Pseudoalteromonas sp. MMG013]|uniref:ATP-binding protein n=1 Tax=Pseudoalteromonas sp. MMG013 TaxID=2822687 RepID=UPI001B364E7F|nr:ATP-binding protein [Pseudoalteromonas sp. MMG013]MBQ4862469.1 AAA family ATPase [Pseudoalteromonas sp. MMG013]